MKNILCVILTVLAWSLQAVAQPDMIVEHYTQEEGLPSNTVYSGLKDRDGFMWFGTDDGLNRFDGYHFRTYRHNSNDSASLSNDRIVSLFEDTADRLWVCTFSNTCYYDYQTDRFHPLVFPDSLQISPLFHFITEDREKNLWMISNSQIVCYPQSGNAPPRSYPEGKAIYPLGITLCLTSTTTNQRATASTASRY